MLPAFLGARLEAGKSRAGRIVIRLPDGRRGMVSRLALRLPRDRRAGLIPRLESLIGVPYLWGGRTCAGLDCSGFTQLVLAEQGIALPRDAREQFRSALPLRAGERTLTGDLVFFGRAGEPVSHVGIMLTESTYVHCRGSVRMASLDPDSPLSEKELIAQVRGVRRPSGAHLIRGHGRARRGKSP